MLWDACARRCVGHERQRGAGSKEYVRLLESIGFRRGSTSPCAAWHKDKGLRLVVHGDDLNSSRTEDDLRWLVLEFEKKCVTKVRGIVGPESHDSRSMTILDRILDWNFDRITFEADPRHVYMIVHGMGLVSGKGSDVVGSVVEQSEGEKELSKDGAFRFRSLAARCNFLSMDRLHMQCARKEICRRMSSPRSRDWLCLKKLARLLVKQIRIAIYAGCKATRKSTSRGCMMIGAHTHPQDVVRYACYCCFELW